MSTILQQQQIWVSSHFNPFREDTHNLRCYDLTIKMVLGGWGPPQKKVRNQLLLRRGGSLDLFLWMLGMWVSSLIHTGPFVIDYRAIELQ